jgi:energy-coupling factor transporter transmembrane protein EcfT
MKAAIYLSGIIGTLLLVFRIIGIMLEFPLNNVFLILGSVLLLIVFLPLIIIERYLQNKKIDKIIVSYKETNKETVPLEKGDSEAKGWGMNNSPFRERKSGLIWGGGNIKGANAKRETRRNFLKR